MSGELIAIVAVGVTLAGLILTSSRGLRQDIRQDMAQLESRVDTRSPLAATVPREPISSY